MLEEAYEAVEAIDEKDPGHLKEELGDVLLQVVFHARMVEEEGLFTWTMWWTASAKSWCSDTPMSLAQWTPGTPAGAEHLGRPEAGGEGAAHRCPTPWTAWPDPCLP